MQHSDWGVRSPRWAAIRSETVEVAGSSVHYLRAEAVPGAPPAAPTHLLVHPLAAAGSFMLDLIGPLTRFGPVVAPDLPGTILGHTETPSGRAARVESNARFLGAFTAALGLGHVIAHGWSMGGAVALRFAAISSDRVERLVLVNSPLPAPLTWQQSLGWQTFGRSAVVVGSRVVSVLLRLQGRRVIDRKLAYLEASVPDQFGNLGGDISRIPADTMAVITDQLEELRAHPARMRHAATAFASVVSGIFIDRRSGWEAIDRVTAPVLLLWGDQDRLIEWSMIEGALARRPDWDLHVLESTGHAAPLEVPGEYAEAVGRWLGEGGVAPRAPDGSEG